MAENPLLLVHNVTKRFGETIAVDDVSLAVADGEFLALLGPSGCGKTTLLRMLAGFELPDKGKIVIGGKDITHLPPNKRPLNMLFQSYAVFPHMTVKQNIAYGLRFLSLKRAECESRIKEVLSMVQMTEFADRLPHQLSGGQRQRVALARCIVLRPKILLLDEPLSALDFKLREAMQLELVKLQKQMGITFIVVTHDQSEALSMATRVAVLDQGRISQIASPQELFESPRNRFTADFVGRMNIIACSIAPTENGLVLVRNDDESSVSGEIGIRPINLTFSSDEPAHDPESWMTIPVTIRQCVYHGTEMLLQCEATQTGQQLMAAHINRHRGGAVPAAGDTGYLSCHINDIIVFDVEDAF